MTHLLDPSLSTRQQQVLAGTILGGSSVVKAAGGRNCYLSMRSRDRRWLEFKAAELSTLASPSPFTKDKTNRWHSMCYPIFNRLRETFYKNAKRRLKMESLDLLNDVAFAVWYGDCGRHENGKVILNTHIWSEAGTQLIVSYFHQIGYGAESFTERGNYRVRLDDVASVSFLELAEPHLPIWMLHNPQEEK